MHALSRQHSRLGIYAMTHLSKTASPAFAPKTKVAENPFRPCAVVGRRVKETGRLAGGGMEWGGSCTSVLRMAWNYEKGWERKAS